MVVHDHTIVRGQEALPEIVPEVVPYNAVIETVWRVIETIEVKKKRVMEKEGAVLIEDQDEQEHSFSMPLSPAR